MKNVLVLGVAALALVGCAKNEEAAVPAETPVVEENVEAVNGGVPQDTGAQTVVGEPSSSEPAKEPTVVYPAEAGATTEAKAAE